MIERLIHLLRWRTAHEPEFRLDRRQFLRFSGALAALPVLPVAAEGLLELLAPRATILLPTTGQVWAVNSLGGYFYSRQLANILRQQVTPLLRFNQFAAVKEFAKVSGVPKHFTWDVYRDGTA